MEFNPYSDGGFGPERVRIKRKCTSCGEMFSKDVSKESSDRHRLCCNCRHNGWMPIVHVLTIAREEGRSDA